MEQEIKKLILYGASPEADLLKRLSKFFLPTENIAQLQVSVYNWIRDLLQLATDYGFDRNLWHCYLTFLLITDCNPFSLCCEKQGEREGSINEFALQDFSVFQQLFALDFSELEKRLGNPCFSILCNYQAVTKKETQYHRSISKHIANLSVSLAEAKTPQEFFHLMTIFYGQWGVGTLGLNKAFRFQVDALGKCELIPISNLEQVYLVDLVGYERQKKELKENTESFLEGKAANNVLLYGDSGTGKSTSIKALVNEYYSDGLRMIEIYKHQFQHLGTLISHLKKRNYRFIIYMDDLSFEEFEIEYKFLKAVIEGGVETRPENILIYATSNRRHLIRENFSDRKDMEYGEDLHRSETIEEKLSLAGRFGINIFYGKPSREDYYKIILHILKEKGYFISKEELKLQADRWEMQHGGISGRTARQFAHYLLGQKNNP